ncbi:MAG: hypothetical protein WAM14_06170 [Candidatus Nitrosopolaris sp.]
MRDFRRYLIQQKIRDVFEHKKRSVSGTNYTNYDNHHKTSNDNKIGWIDTLLETPIEDHRKHTVSMAGWSLHHILSTLEDCLTKNPITK